MLCADGRLVLLGMERAHATDYLIGVDQKVPTWLMKVAFLVTGDAILGLFFFLFNNTYSLVV